MKINKLQKKKKEKGKKEVDESKPDQKVRYRADRAHF
jgi:hypothetical protein